MSQSSDLIDGFSQALDQLESALSDEDTEKHMSLKNTRMWLKINQEDRPGAVALFIDLSNEVSKPDKPTWLEGSLVHAGRLIGQILGKDAADEV